MQALWKGSRRVSITIGCSVSVSIYTYGSSDITHHIYLPLRDLPEVSEVRQRLWDESRKEVCASLLKATTRTP